MTDGEQIDLLRREVADLRERLARLEARPFTPPPVVTMPHPGVQPIPFTSSPTWPFAPYVTCQTAKNHITPLDGGLILVGSGLDAKKSQALGVHTRVYDAVNECDLGLAD